MVNNSWCVVHCVKYIPTTWLSLCDNLVTNRWLFGDLLQTNGWPLWNNFQPISDHPKWLFAETTCFVLIYSLDLICTLKGTVLVDNLWSLCTVPILLPDWGPLRVLVSLQTKIDVCDFNQGKFYHDSHRDHTSWVCTLKLHGKRWKSSGLSHPRRVSQSYVKNS